MPATTRATPSPFRRCSQTRTTAHPRERSARDWFESLSMFLEIFGSQYCLFVAGIRLHFGHPCQKQPSMKIASFACGKAKSGFPAIGKCRLHPLTPDARNAEATTSSVERLPRDLTAAMIRDLSTKENLSDTRTMVQISTLLRACHTMRFMSGIVARLVRDSTA